MIRPVIVRIASRRQARRDARVLAARVETAQLFGLADWIEDEIKTNADGHYVAAMAAEAVRHAARQIRACL